MWRLKKGNVTFFRENRYFYLRGTPEIKMTSGGLPASRTFIKVESVIGDDQK